ncbi:IclR family transcriptional regulator [Bradyrhizobium sp. LHD-71]|uniref:IclR family transcriptional regulator n=1 Tax=Bradyrhizobium sp. LHD-71 TaxID=3072141 RepID=UPI00280D3E00|nr:IclR family transcriptional regulator [Bradyrhizobium sp. LHD-71]MDQ8729320.1 IclR family transcriptional regulator [Bradyrhizobium sp. LHD-71]
MSDTAPSEKNSVQSLAKGFRVLEAFTAERLEMGLAEVARAAGVDNATAFRFLNTLVQLGYIEKISETKRFRLTLKCLDLGFSAIARTDLRELARPLLRELVNETIEAASIAVPDGSEVVYIERVQAGLARLGVDVRIGSRVPAYSTAVGQIILAYLPRDAQVAALDAAPRRKLTATTLTALDALLARLQQVRQKGFALSDQENVTGLRVLAAPVLDADGVPLAALSVAAPAFAMPLKTFETSSRGPVIAAAKKLSRAVQAAGAGTMPIKRQSPRS